MKTTKQEIIENISKTYRAKNNSINRKKLVNSIKPTLEFSKVSGEIDGYQIHCNRKNNRNNSKITNLSIFIGKNCNLTKLNYKIIGGVGFHSVEKIF